MVAIAQLGKADAVSPLQRFLFSANPVVRKNVAYGLSYSMTPEPVVALINSVPDKDTSVRERIRTSLTGLNGAFSRQRSRPTVPCKDPECLAFLVAREQRKGAFS